MDLEVRPKLTPQQPRSQLRKGWVYTCHSLRFEIAHPIVFCLILSQIIISICLFSGLFSFVFLVSSSQIEPIFVITTILSYFFTSTVTVLLNGTIAGYVLATELGVLQPLSQAIEEVRNQLVSLVGYAIVWSGVVSTFVILDWISTVGILTGPLNVAVQISAFGMNFAWALGTVFVVPILVFEPTTSLRGAIRRSAAFLKESVICLLVFWFIGAAIFVSIVCGGIAAFFVSNNPLTVIIPIIAFFSGSIICYTLSTVFNSLLYGEVAGPLNLSKSNGQK